MAFSEYMNFTKKNLTLQWRLVTMSNEMWMCNQNYHYVLWAIFKRKRLTMKHKITWKKPSESTCKSHKKCNIKDAWVISRYVVVLWWDTTKKKRNEKATKEGYNRYHSRFFVQVGHETTYAAMGNHHFFAIPCHRQTYQNY